MDTTTYATGDISNEGLVVLKQKVDKLNKRARRLGQDAITVNVIGQHTVTREHPSGINIPVTLNQVEIRGVVPKVDGWQVIAVVTFTPVGNLLATAPGIGDLDPAYRTCVNHCGHCHTKRHRNDLVVIRHETGTELAVGRNCLADFIRTGDVQGMLDYAAYFNDAGLWIDEAETEHWSGLGGGGGASQESLDTILHATAIVVRRMGWTSSKAAYENPGMVSTKSNVLQFLYGWLGGRACAEAHRQWIDAHKLYSTEQDKQEVVLANEWLAGLSANPENDYLYNLKVLHKMRTVPNNNIGLAVSIIAASKRAREQKLEYEKKNAGPREWLGTPGLRIKGIPVTVLSTFERDSAYGPSTIVRFRYDQGILVWFASGARGEDFTEGEEYIIDATVKSHEDHEKYGKSTIITRVRCQCVQKPKEEVS